MKVKSLCCVQLFEIPWTEKPARLQSMGFSRQEYWSGLPFPSPGDLPNPGTELVSPALSEVKSLSRVRLFATPWTEEPGRLQSMGFSRQEYWSGMPSPSPMIGSTSYNFKTFYQKIKSKRQGKQLLHPGVDMPVPADAPNTIVQARRDDTVGHR